MANSNLELINIFQNVTQMLNQNQQTLNDADEYNHDHGDHMLNTFQTITDALQKKQGGSSSDALTYAAQVLSKTANSGSGKLYAEGLLQAANQVQGQTLDSQMGMQMLQALLSGGQAQATQTQSQQPARGGLLGSLLGGLLGGGKQQQSGGLSDGLDMEDLLTAGMAFMQSKQRGEDNLNAIVDGLTAASGMGNQPYRQQSTQLVADSFMKALSGLGTK